MPFDYEAAKAAGYSDREIKGFLGSAAAQQPVSTQPAVTPQVGNPAVVDKLKNLVPGNPAATQEGLNKYSAKVGENLASGQDPMAAKKVIQNTAQEISDLYDKLYQSGGAQDTQGNILNNAANYASASVPGVGHLLGTNNQAIRDQIEAKRPLLISQLKNATGMSAQQLNSNAELGFYLNAMTNPSATYQANKGIISDFAKSYGTAPLDTKSAFPVSREAAIAELNRRNSLKAK